jgi:hypothetical protein
MRGVIPPLPHTSLWGGTLPVAQNRVYRKQQFPVSPIPLHVSLNAEIIEAPVMLTLCRFNERKQDAYE